MNEPSAWVFYPFALLVTAIFICIISSATVAESIAATHALHGIATFGALHWVKGSPDYLSNVGTWRGSTLWEQIEPGEHWTPTKKYLLLVPTILLLLTLFTGSYSTRIMLINIPIWVILTIAKFPCMEGVRIFGINSIIPDDEYDYEVPADVLSQSFGLSRWDTASKHD